jgi:hypothetical protein
MRREDARQLAAPQTGSRGSHEGSHGFQESIAARRQDHGANRLNIAFRTVPGSYRAKVRVAS